MAPEREPACPKQMVYGPCGGVRADGLCEMGPTPCPFALLETAIPFEVVPAALTAGDPAAEAAARPRTSRLLELARHRPAILTDFTVPAFDLRTLQGVTRVLADSCDAVLVGEHQNRPDFPPTLMAELIAGAGGRAWVTLSCRDRNRLVLEQEIAGLAHVGVDAVLCVTGDGRAQGIRPGVTQVFDLDGTRLAALAAAAGLVVAVPESPDAPPTGLRPSRLWQKQRAGASVCVLNHARSAASLADFVGRARRLGVTLPVIASVAIFTDERSAAVLSRFPGLELDAAHVASVLSAADPVEAGIRAAATEAAEVLKIPGVVGVNLSGLASGRGELVAAEVKAAAGQLIREQQS